MFKTVLTLFRGSVAAAGEELEDRTALLILDQQMRDAAAAVERSKRTLALAIAQDGCGAVDGLCERSVQSVEQTVKGLGGQR